MADVYKRITNWNGEIIQPINELATNPPEGCDPLTELPEAEENHLWMKQNIVDVRDKLKEICEDNDFTGLEVPQLITIELIQEIKDAIANGWCAECADEQEEELTEWSLGTWTCRRESGTRNINQCCGIEIEVKDFLSQYTGYDVYKYTSEYYNPMEYSVGNNQNWTILQDTFIETRRASVSWCGKRRSELLQQRTVEQKSEEIKNKQETLNILQQQLAACTSNCGTIQTQISEIEQEIGILENEIQEAKQKRDEYKQEAENYLTKANMSATANWAALAALKSWDPQTINIVADLISGITSEWGVGKYPFNYRIGRWGVGYKKQYIHSPNYIDTGNTMVGSFTPSGLPYSKNGPIIWGSDWYRAYQKKHCCGIWEMNQGLCIIGECFDWEDFEIVNDLPSVHTEGDTLELKVGITHGTKPAENYNPDP